MSATASAARSISKRALPDTGALNFVSCRSKFLRFRLTSYASHAKTFTVYLYHGKRRFREDLIECSRHIGARLHVEPLLGKNICYCI